MSSIEDKINTLNSKDATERLRAVAELGEEGNPTVAPRIKDIIWNDKSPSIQQIAVQSYAEILGDESIDEMRRIIETHHDSYVIQYALGALGNFKSDNVETFLGKLIESEDDNFRTTVLRSIIRSNSDGLKDKVLQVLTKEKYPLAIRNCIEALALWKYKKSKKLIEEVMNMNENDLEIKTISLFALAVFGDKKAKKALMGEEIDDYTRITVNNTNYKGRKGLLLALDEI